MPDFAIPGTHPISIDSRPYLLDIASEQFSYESIPLLNPQLQQTADQVNESSLNPEGLWRKSQATWHKGAGQTYLDKPDSDAARFRSSLGVDVWTQGEISMLPAVNKLYTGDPKFLVWQLSKLYVSDGFNILKYSDIYTPGSSTTIDINLAEPDVAITSMIPFGIGLLAAVGTNGIHSYNGTVAAHYSDLQVNVIAYVAGRLMGAYLGNIYNITSVPAAPSPLFTHPDGLFNFIGFAEAKGHIFAAGANILSKNSYIYKTAIKPDGTALEIPSISAPLPEGEEVTAIYGYLNFILIGTSKGVRFAVPDGDGNLDIGALIETPHPVLAFEGQGAFVWFGWMNYDGTHTGLGRCDLRTIVGGVAPAYASDLQAVDQGQIWSVITDPSTERRVFAVGGSGVYVESGNKVTTATIDSGFITYDLPEEKEARFVDVRYRVLEGSDAVYIANESSAFTLLRTNTAADYLTRIPAGNLVGNMHEIRHIFTRSSTDTTKGPVLTRHTLKSQVKVDMGAYWYLPLIIASDEVTNTGNDYHRNVLDEFQHLAALASAKSSVALKILSTTYTVTISDVKFVPSTPDDNKIAYQGTLIVKAKIDV